MSTSVRLAIVGMGLIGKRHAEAINNFNGAVLSGVVDPSDTGRNYCLENALPCYNSLDSLFKAHAIDGVILSTPTSLHVEQGLECIERKCAVLVEKPLSTNVKDGSRLVAAAHQLQVPILVGHHRRYNPIIEKAHELINNGALGEIRAVSANCWFYKPDEYFDVASWRKKKGAGPISVNLVHDVDLLRYLCGEIISVQAQTAPSARGYENEGVAAAVFRFENGALGTISISDSIAAPWSWEMTSRENPVYPTTEQSCYLLGGSKASLSLPDLRLWSHQNGIPDWCTPINAKTVKCETSDPLVNQIKHFVDVIKNKATPLVSGREGLKTLRIIEAIQDSARTGKTIFPELK